MRLTSLSCFVASLSTSFDVQATNVGGFNFHCLRLLTKRGLKLNSGSLCLSFLCPLHDCLFFLSLSPSTHGECYIKICRQIFKVETHTHKWATRILHAYLPTYLPTYLLFKWTFAAKHLARDSSTAWNLLKGLLTKIRPF